MDVNDVLATEWFPPLRNLLRGDLHCQTASLREQQPALEKECQTLRIQCQGWAVSLANPDLPVSLRAVIEADWERALARVKDIENLLAEFDGRHVRIDQVLDPAEAVKNLQRLQDALASNNPTLGNLELSLHVDRLDCFSDGRVVLRTCKLGALPEALALLTEGDRPAAGSGTQPAEALSRIGKPRRRTRLQTDPLAADAADRKDAASFAADPERFAALATHWFWEDTLHIPVKTCWAADHAAEVAQLRATGSTVEKLAAHFGKTVPTIRAALHRAAQADPAVNDPPRKMPRSRWAVDHAAEVARLKQQGMSTRDIAKRFNQSDTTIREALRIAEDQRKGT